MNEIALALGTDRHLVGVLTPPIGPRRPLAVVLLNAGVVHRIGPHRNSVKLARHLASQGYTALRFDVSGIGDSRMPRDGAPMREQILRDVRTALDHLQSQYGLQAFALYGICAGARMAYEAALADARVAGIFMLDGFAYPTWKARRVRYAARLRALTPQRVPAVVWRHLSGSLTAGLRRSVADDGKPRLPTPPSSQPTRKQFAADMQAMVNRGLHVAMMYSGSVFGEYSYPAQLQDAFASHDFVAHIVCHHAPDIDHLVTSLASQRRLLELVDAWVAQTVEGHSTERLPLRHRTPAVAQTAVR
jgi:hypothetical protein